MNDPVPAQRSTFSAISARITAFRTFVTNLLFVFILIAIFVGLLSATDDGTTVPDGGALVLHLQGPLLETPPDFDPLSLLFREDDMPRPLILRDLVKGLRTAAEDERIAALVLDVDEFPGAAPATLRALGDALEEFAASGKPIFTGADFLGRAQYLLASHATHLFLNPQGQILLHGFASRSTYFASALEKLHVKVHVFRVGEYKSAVEPFLRNDMSEAAREAKMALVQGLWAEYRERVASNRELPPETLDDLLNDMPERLRALDGDLARLALDTGLVDELLTQHEFRTRVADLVGQEEDSDDFRAIGMDSYLDATRFDEPDYDDTPRIGVIVAEGFITGTSDTGQIGKNTAALIREARANDDIAALVLRVNSPGGSAFFSEVIRKELELAQLEQKPVVASFGGVAASGGYWIGATADHIVAEPDTITGSIGIFGILPTFEDSAQALGITRDGVGTHELSSIGNALEPLNPALADLLQQSVTNGYERFLNLVANGRHMTTEEVDEIAQGRVWLGRTAIELGLVDELGGLDTAAAAAAQAAGLETWELTYLEKPQSAGEMFLEELFATSIATGLKQLFAGPTARTLSELADLASTPLTQLGLLKDPGHAYALCTRCPETP